MKGYQTPDKEITIAENAIRRPTGIWFFSNNIKSAFEELWQREQI